jgi:DUF4097 and DUF4098 domain-containing protein YvlB
MTGGNALRLNVSTRSGRVRIQARTGAALEVRGADMVTEPDGTWRITSSQGGSHAVEVVCPEGTDVIVGTSSGRVELLGPIGDARVTTRSARISIEHAARVDARTWSGAVEVGTCTGECRVVTKSSRVKVGSAASLDVSAMSGRVEVGDVADAVVRTMSGRVEVSTRNSGRVEVRTLSGAVEVEVPRDRRPSTLLKSLSGRVRCDCAQGNDGEINVATTSGSIRVTCR